MRLAHLLGNERLKEALAPLFKEDFPQSVILEGAEGLGKRTAAFSMAQALMCQEKDGPCGQCGPCVRMKAGSHPDYQLFNPEGGMIKVDDVREIRRLSFIRPSESSRKIFVLNDSGRMNPQAQNALLKVLEEPRETVFILLCRQAGELLETVRSRCVRYALDPLPQAMVEEELEKRQPEKGPAARRRAAERCGGSLGRALQLLEGEESRGCAAARRFLNALPQGEWQMLAACVDAGSLSREEFAIFCDEVCVGLWHLAREKGGEEWILSLYDYVRGLSARAQWNASVSAMSGGLAATCGQLLFAGPQGRKYDGSYRSSF